MLRALFQLVARTRFELVISALRGRCPRPLDERAMLPFGWDGRICCPTIRRHPNEVHFCTKEPDGAISNLTGMKCISQQKSSDISVEKRQRHTCGQILCGDLFCLLYTCQHIGAAQHLDGLEKRWRYHVATYGNA